MTLAQLIALCHAKLASLSAERTMAERLGDAEAMARLDAQITATTTTLDALTSL
jgi:hypothetical protein